MNMVWAKTIYVFFFVIVTPTESVSDVCKGGAECVVISQCPGIFDQYEPTARQLRGLHCGFNDRSTPMICCPPQFYNEWLISNLLSELGLNAKEGTAKLLPDHSICGKYDGDDRINGGTQTDIDEHPWMALLGYTKPSGLGFHCGGVLISSRYVLTAAHCIRGSQIPSNWRLSHIRLGEWDTSTTLDCRKDDCAPPHLDVPVEEVFTHEGFDAASVNQHDDIGLIRLSLEVPFSDFVKPICLPRSPELRRNTFEGYDMDVAGWGQTEIDRTSNIKLKVRLPIVNSSYCVTMYATAERRITGKQICAGGLPGQDSCRGDSGGPLMARDHLDNWMAVGIISYGPSPCGSAGWPAIYTRVTAYIDWIVSKLRP